MTIVIYFGKKKIFFLAFDARSFSYSCVYVFLFLILDVWMLFTVVTVMVYSNCLLCEVNQNQLLKIVGRFIIGSVYKRQSSFWYTLPTNDCKLELKKSIRLNINNTYSTRNSGRVENLFFFHESCLFLASKIKFLWKNDAWAVLVLFNIRNKSSMHSFMFEDCNTVCGMLSGSHTLI